jgi:AraC-like DNA-binding protein
MKQHDYRNSLVGRSGYSQIKDKVRRDIAVRRLTESEDSITEIAFLVGYSEINNFTRAFKSWCGINPSGFRKQHGCTINSSFGVHMEQKTRITC